MKIVNISKQEFDKSSFSHPLHSFYQTSMYGNLMKNYKYKVSYYGFLDEKTNTLLGVTMMLTKNLLLGYKYGYCPRGFLIDYNDEKLIDEITNELKIHFKPRNYIFIKIDPLIIKNKLSKTGDVLPSVYTSNLDIILTNKGYYYYDRKTLKPRFNGLLKVTGSSETIFKKLDSKTKEKITIAKSSGIEIFKGTNNDIEKFYALIKNKQKNNLKFYQNLSACYQNSFEIYFAKIKPYKYLENVKRLYNIEVQNYETISNDILEKKKLGLSYDEKIKIYKETEEKIEKYRLCINEAQELINNKVEEKVIATCAIILDKYWIEFLIEQEQKEYSKFNSLYLLKWYIIEKYAKQGAIYFDLNGLKGKFSDDNFYERNKTNLDFNTDITEYIGEFDLVLNENIYKIYKKINK